MVIKVDGLTRHFSYYKKDAGLKGSVKNLFHRETIVKQAVKGVSFEIDEGEMVGFLGPNGAGKTTTLKMLSGILFPTSGTASVLGYIPWERRKDFKKKMAIVMGQKSQLWWDLPANESLQLNKSIYEISDSDYEHTIGELSELLDVRELLKVQVRRLSLGERMKMELIASLMHKPRVLFLDEPTIGLDLISQKRIRDFFKYYNQETKTTVILTSHYMKDIEDLCKRTIVINDGQLVYDGELNRINELFSEKKIIKLVLSERIDENTLYSFGKVKQFTGYNATIEIDRQSLKFCSQTILDKLPVVDFNIEDVPVEDGISMLYQKKVEKGEADEKVC